MNILLSRINGDEGDASCPVDRAAREQAGLRSVIKMRVTDFSEATDHISWTYCLILSEAFMELWAVRRRAVRQRKRVRCGPALWTAKGGRMRCGPGGKAKVFFESSLWAPVFFESSLWAPAVGGGRPVVGGRKGESAAAAKSLGGGTAPMAIGVRGGEGWRGTAPMGRGGDWWPSTMRRR